MSFLPHPETIVSIAEQRSAEYRAEAARARLAHEAQTCANRPRDWLEQPALRAVALLLALLHATSQRG